MSEFKKKFDTTIRAKLQQRLHLKNSMQAPRLTKIVVNMGIKDAVLDKKNVERAEASLGLITGQKPRVARAKKSIAGFKLREGDPIGIVVTMRGVRMYAFFDKLVGIVLPRLRDFHGVKRESFDPNGNYTLGLQEQAVFPEIDPSQAEKIQGLEICFVTSAKNKEEGFALLEEMGMPFAKVE